MHIHIHGLAGDGHLCCARQCVTNAAWEPSRMADKNKFEHKTVKAVRGTDGIVIAKMEKAGWEFVDQTSATLRTSLNFRRPKNPMQWKWVGIGAVAVLVAVVITVGAIREEDAPQPASDWVARDANDLSAVNYASEDDLLDAAIKAGYHCPHRKVEETGGLASVVRASCSIHDSFQILQFEREGEALDDFIDGIIHDPEHVSEKGLEDKAIKDDAYLVGPNWVIYGELSSLANVQRGIGGTIANPNGR